MSKTEILLLIFILAFTISCNKKDKPDITPDTGHITIGFEHRYKNEPVKFDTLAYINAADNHLLFSEIQYFISEVTLHYGDGSNYLIHKLKDIHYVDSDIPSTQTWDVFDSIPAGSIDSISFTFGINEDKNQSGMYVNPPESLMFWPDILGGGYHYMKLNGKWINEQQEVTPFNFHLGIGQIYDTAGNITGFVHNHFTTGARLPVHSSYALHIVPGHTSGIVLVMNLESWFEGPHTWDFNYWGGMIMQNQEAMATGCENGRDAFTLDSPFYITK